MEWTACALFLTYRAKLRAQIKLQRTIYNYYQKMNFNWFVGFFSLAESSIERKKYLIQD